MGFNTALAATTALALSGAILTQSSSGKSTGIVLTAPTTIRVNTNVTFTGRLVDAWDPVQGVGGVQVNWGIGDRFSMYGSRASTSNNGSFTFAGYFNAPGRYRVTAQFPGGWGWQDSRTTIFVNVVR